MMAAGKFAGGLVLLSLEATYYRTGLLLGVLGGAEVRRWAEQVIEQESDPPAELIELVTLPTTDLSALRHSLFPLVIDPEPEPVLHAVLALLHHDLASGKRTLKDTITVLRQMRSMLRLPRSLYDALNVTLIAHTNGQPALEQWLRRFANDGLSAEPPDGD